jgi:hypothetical protein
MVPGALEHLDVQVGNKAVKGAWIGGVLGVIVGYVGAGFARGFCEYDCPSDLELGFAVMVNTGIWAGVGAIIGSGSAKLERRF